MSDFFFHMTNNNNNNNNNNSNDDDDDQILLMPKRMYYRIAYLINKVPFETTVLWCIFCYRVYIFLSVSSLIFKLFPTDKASFICLICYLTFFSLYVSQFQLGTSPTGNPWGLAQKTCPRGRDLTQSGAPGRVIGWTNFSH